MNVMLTNITNIMNNFFDWMLQGYTNIVGFFFWPILFSAIIMYIYLKNQSAFAAGIAILIFFAAFASTGVWANVPGLVLGFQLIVTIVCAAVVLIFVAKWRQ